MITRAEILARARAVPLRSDDYSQTRPDGDGANARYRPDCSGWVSYCWGVRSSGPGTWGGYSTSTFITTDYAPGVPGIMYEIPRGELRPGDAIGHCGPTTAGNGGHIALWLGKSGDQEHIIDMPGGWGPIDHAVTWGVSGNHWNSAGNIKAWRFRGVAPDAPAPPVVPATIVPGAAFPLPAGNYYGDVHGPAASHGGGVAHDRPVIAAIQRRLIALGFVPGITAGSAAVADWADGVYGDGTIAAVRRLQEAHGVTVDGETGPTTWHLLFPANPAPAPTPAPTPEPAPAPVPTDDLAALTARVNAIETALAMLPQAIAEVVGADLHITVTAG